MVIRQAVTMLATRGSSPDGTMRVLSVAAAGLLFRARAVIRHAPFASQSPIRAWAMAVKAHVVGAARVAPARPFHLPRAQVAQIHRGPLQAAEFQCAVPQRLLARFLIVYRRADTTMRAVAGSSRWGLEGPEFAPFVSAHPANPVAALASYWATHTAQQLEFEHAHPQICHRVPIEDLTGNTDQALPDISDFLALEGALVSPLGWDRQPDIGVPDAAPRLPIDRIPASLLAQGQRAAPQPRVLSRHRCRELTRMSSQERART